MNNALRRLGVVTASMAVTAGLVSGVSLVVGSTAEARNTKVTATTSVNVRSGPGTQYRIVGAISTGQSLPIKGTAKEGWTQVSYSGATAWISSRYVVAGGDDGSGTKAGATTGRRYGTAPLNVRTSPSLNAGVITVTAVGYGFDVTGKTQNGYTEVSYHGKSRWVTSRYLSETKPGSTKPTKAEKWVYGTTALNVRTSPSIRASVVDIAGKGYGFLTDGDTKNGYTEVTFKGTKRWVTSQYLSTKKPAAGTPGPTAPTSKLPKVTGTRYATTALNIRSASSGGITYSEVPRGTKLSVTGKVENGRAQIVYKNAVRWVTAQYLSSKAPATIPPSGAIGGGGSVGMSGLTPNSKYLVARLQARFPAVKSYYGVRPDAIPDHPSGRAVDAMLPSYSSASGRALGREMADYIRANAASLNVEYIIYDQKIWNVRRSSEGWRYMADRGSDNANHKNHVHVTTF